jgi:hypothetical protein
MRYVIKRGQAECLHIYRKRHSTTRTDREDDGPTGEVGVSVLPRVRIFFARVPISER